MFIIGLDYLVKLRPDGKASSIKLQGDRLVGNNTKAVEITDDNFTEAIEDRAGLALVDFWAEWCGPCRMIAPIIEELAEAYDEEDLLVGKLDVDTNQGSVVRFSVRSIPSILFFKDGQHVDTVVGMVSRSALEDKIQEHT